MRRLPTMLASASAATLTTLAVTVAVPVLADDGGGGNGADEFAAGVRAFRDSVPLDFIREFQASTIHRPLSPQFVDRVVQESRRLPPHVWRGIVNGMIASEPVAGAIDARIPTLILWGDRDAVFPRAAQDSLLAALPEAELTVHPETGHAVHWERPDAVARELSAFLATVRGEP